MSTLVGGIKIVKAENDLMNIHTIIVDIDLDFTSGEGDVHNNQAGVESNVENTKSSANTKGGSGDFLENYAHELMMGRSLSDENNIKVKHNSKGVKIYCIANMSMCKTETEVRDYFE